MLELVFCNNNNNNNNNAKFIKRHDAVRRLYSLTLVLQLFDYGNATLAGIPSHLTKWMRSVLNSAARLVFAASRYDCITPLLTQLHWPNVPERIEFKLAVLAYRCLDSSAVPR